MSGVRTVADDPHAALNGLLALTFLLEFSLGAALVWTALADGSWWRMGAWLFVTGFLFWTTWKAGRIVRGGLGD